VKQCINILLISGLCIPLIHGATKEDLPDLAKPQYYPTTKHALGIGGGYAFPWRGSVKKQLHVFGNYGLVTFPHNHLSTGLSLSYRTASMVSKKFGLTLEEKHLGLAPTLALTGVSNEFFYFSVTIWLSFELDILLKSTCTRDENTDINWSPRRLVGNIIFGERVEFLYGLYVEWDFILPVTEIIRMDNKTQRYKDEYDCFVDQTRMFTAHFFEIGVGLNVYSLLYPPQPQQSP
jgi:hypothetical protein